MSVTSKVGLTLMRVNKNPNDMYRRYTADYLVFGQGVVFKDDTDVVNPVIELMCGDFGTVNWIDFQLYNYVQMDFKKSDNTILITRFYWVNKCETITNKLVRLHLFEDVLYTFGQGIRKSTQWVSRAKDLCDPWLNDPLTIISGKPKFSFTNVTSILSAYSGKFVIGLTGCDDGTNASALACERGAVKYFILDAQTIENVIETLQHLTGYVADLNPMDRIVSCMYIPCAISTGLPPSTTVTFYFTDANGNADNKQITFDAYTPASNTNGVVNLADVYFNLPIHNQDDANHHYLRQTPYSVYVLHAGAFGDIEINNDMIETVLGVETLYLGGKVDIVSGQAQLYVGAGMAYRREVAMVGVPVPLTQIVSNSYYQTQSIKNNLKLDLMERYANIIGSSASSIPSALASLGDKTGKSLVGTAGNAIGAWANIATSSQIEEVVRDQAGLSLYNSSLPVVTTMGASGSMLGIVDDWYLTSIFYQVKFPDHTMFGYPYHGTSSLSTLTGYVKCDTALWNGTSASGELMICNNEERALINQFLTNGIYINT